ncbi:MAG: transglycosylase SLT domain-containing protein [Pseudomonadota bacterium]
MKIAALLVLIALGAAPAWADPVRPALRAEALPATQWAHRPDHALWTRAALAALKGHGAPLVEMTPGDVARWCPAYRQAPPAQRRAFWVGFLSALAKYESTWRARAVGGGGRWHGLLQILPATARGYGCAARTGAALQDGGANLSCAIRIMAQTVPRDGVIHARDGRWRGVSADWGPMRSAVKRRAIAAWTAAQPYCRAAMLRPRPRPAR